MSLKDTINQDVKDAMKAKDKLRLEAVRAIKSALMLAETQKGATEATEEDEMKMLQKLVKQRKEAATIFEQQGRADLAQYELDQVKIIEGYLPEAMSEEEVKAIIDEVIQATNASSMKDMGKVMGQVNQKVAGRADGKLIAEMVKSALN